MSLLHPWGLAALLSLPAILAIHFFRRRYPPRRVAGLFLWPEDVRSPATGRRWTRLARSASLVAELLAAAVASLLVAGPYVPRSGPVRHVTVVADASASMAATSRSGRTFHEEAVEELAGLLAAAREERSDLRLAVLSSGPRPAMLAGPSAPVEEALGALREFRPGLPSHSLAGAVELARQISGPEGSLVVLSDDPEAARGAGAREGEILAAGEPRANLALTLARRDLLADGKSRVYLVVRNFSDAPAMADLAIEAGGRFLGTRRLEVGPGGSTEGSWEFEAGAGAIEVRLAPDALALDDRVLLEEPRRRALAVACAVEGESRSRRIERACRAVPDVEWLGPAGGEAHVRVVEGDPAPAPGDPAWYVAFGAIAGEGEPLPPLLGPYLADSSGGLMAALDFKGVIWGGARPWAADPGVRPLLLAGDHVLVARRPGRPDVLFNLDLSRSNVHKSPGWPLFWSRLLEARRAELAGLDRANYVSGEMPELRLAPAGSPAAREIEVETPSGETRTVRVGSKGGPLPAFSEPGRYVVLEEGEELGRFAVAFDDPSESDLRGRSSARLARIEGTLVDSAAFDEIGPPWLWPLLAGAIAAVAFANWWIVARGA